MPHSTAATGLTIHSIDITAALRRITAHYTVQQLASKYSLQVLTASTHREYSLVSTYIFPSQNKARAYNAAIVDVNKHIGTGTIETGSRARCANALLSPLPHISVQLVQITIAQRVQISMW